MLLRSIDLLFSNPGAFVDVIIVFFAAVVPALLIAVTVHEFSHALVATYQGDYTAKMLGRLSLNPRRHLDPMGSIMILLVGFGWGKPVPVNPYYLRSGPRAGMSAVSVAGPLSNLITAFLCAVPIRAGLVPWHSPFAFTGLEGPLSGLFADLLGFVIFYNIILAIFNMIPLAPLDGSKVAIGLLPPGPAAALARREAIGPVILLGVIMLDWATNLNLLWGVLRPIVNVVGLVIVGQDI